MLNTSERILFNTTLHRYTFFCKYHTRNSVWNWLGSMEDCLPLHSWNFPFYSILASSMFHTEISVLFHFPFHALLLTPFAAGVDQSQLQLFSLAFNIFTFIKLKSKLVFDVLIGQTGRYRVIDWGSQNSYFWVVPNVTNTSKLFQTQ